MKRSFSTLTTAFIFALISLTGCTADGLLSEDPAGAEIAASSEANDKACWGQASAVFAQMGEMGIHSSEQSEPRAGLANLARLLYELEMIEDDTMQALGAFVAEGYGLEIDACM